jgi:hypothetical protein
MLWVPQKGPVRIITNGGIVGSATPGTALPSNATTLLDGAVTEIISSGNNNQDSWGIWINITATGLAATAAEACADILIGGATDDVLIAALICGYQTVIGGGGANYFFPLHIPQGKRIAAMLASVRTSITARILVWLYGGGVPPWRVGSMVSTYGTQINNARGQAVVPTASGGTASVTEMIASSSYDHFAFLPGFQAATDITITPTGEVNIGIGVGAATEERIGTWWWHKDTGENMTGPIPPYPAFRDVPSGTRLTMLASNSGANDTAYDGLIYAVR